MTRYPSRLARAYDESLDYERKLRKDNAEMKQTNDRLERELAACHEYENALHQTIVEQAELLKRCREALLGVCFLDEALMTDLEAAANESD